MTPDPQSTRRLGRLRRFLNPARTTQIVDVGSNPTSPPPYQAMVEAGVVQVTGFEPQLDAFVALEKRTTDHERHFPYVIGDGTPGELRVCRGSGFTSLLEPRAATIDHFGLWHRKAEVTDRIAVETKRLDDIPEITQMDLLKIDIQGGETAVFAGAQNLLSKTLAVITEVAFVPLYEGQPLMDAQMADLRAHGFDLHKFLHSMSVKLTRPETEALTTNRNRNQLVDGDAVFIRAGLDIPALETEPLKHLALLADGAFHSCDMVLVILAELVRRGAIDSAALDAYLRLVPDKAKQMEAAQ